MLQEQRTLGPYIVGVKQTRREKFAAWYGVLALFFVVLIPTLNSTSLAYFTKQVGDASECLCTLTPSLRYSGQGTTSPAPSRFCFLQIVLQLHNNSRTMKIFLG